MPNKKTHEQYVQELKDKNLSIEVLEPYINSLTKIKHRCLKCGFEWNTRPANILQQKLCPKCIGRFQTHEEFMEEIKDTINPNVEIIGRYEGSAKYVECRCKVCGYEWKAPKYNIKKGCGCKNCRNKNTGDRCRMPEAEFQKVLNERFNGKISLASPYRGASSYMLFHCNDCGYEWSYLNGDQFVHNKKGCPRCTGCSRRTHEEYVKDVEAFGKVKVIGTFQNTNTPILVECVKCGNQWQASAGMFLSGAGCRLCAAKDAGIRNTKSQEAFEEDVKKVHSYIKIIGKYTAAKDKIECLCERCGNVWSPTADHLLNGTGCPRCAAPGGEQAIISYLDSHNIEYTHIKKFDDLLSETGHHYSYDFYIPKYRLLIEYQGQQHYKPIDYFGGIKSFENQQKRDEIKRVYAKKNNYRLLEIRYDENVTDVLDNYFNSLVTVETTGAA